MNGEQMSIFETSIRPDEACPMLRPSPGCGYFLPIPAANSPIAPGTRLSDPVTSHEAEAKVRPHASTGRRLVLAALALRPATDFELAEATGWQQTSIGKRRGECVALGYVEAFTAPDGTKCKRPSPSGSPAIVWAITQAGRIAHEEMRNEPR